MAVLENHKIDLMDPVIFPNFKKRWHSYQSSLASQGSYQFIIMHMYLSNFSWEVKYFKKFLILECFIYFIEF